ncbi:MAG: hypothetical protein GY925_07180 [Actinomycetia bacterium]|nr:hypothetical protein [Actinomycetes bacterium]
MIDSHLGSGHDVVVPQFLGRVEFIERLERAALAAGVAFVEVMLVGESASAVARFGARREFLAGRSHPEGDVAESEVESMIAAAAGALADVYGQRSKVRRVAATGDVDGTCSALMAALGEPDD